MHHDSDSPLGQAGLILLEKGRYERYLLLLNLANSKTRRLRNRSVHFGCIVCSPYSLHGYLQGISAVTISHDVGYLELLILVKAMREPNSGIGEK